MAERDELDNALITIAATLHLAHGLLVDALWTPSGSDGAEYAVSRGEGDQLVALLKMAAAYADRALEDPQ